MITQSIVHLRNVLAPLSLEALEEAIATGDKVAAMAEVRRQKRLWLQTRRARTVRPGSVKRYASRVTPRVCLAVRRYMAKHPGTNHKDVQMRYHIGNNREVSYIMSGRKPSTGGPKKPVYDRKGKVIR